MNEEKTRKKRVMEGMIRSIVRFKFSSFIHRIRFPFKVFPKSVPIERGQDSKERMSRDRKCFSISQFIQTNSRYVVDC